MKELLLLLLVLTIHLLQAFNNIRNILYIHLPTNGASGPKIIPSNKDTKYNGIKTSVSLFKKSLILLNVVKHSSFFR